jgi:UDP-3-O-[3-hydroxymyristoyl] glucosamine N-acyltransferase
MSTRFSEPKTLGQLALLVNGQVHGNPGYSITGVATLMAATKQDISFLANGAYRPALETTQAGAVILSPEDQSSCDTNALITDNPHAAYAKIATLCVPNNSNPDGEIAQTAVVHATADVHPNVVLGEFVVVGAHAKIGAGTVIHSGCSVGDSVHIGENCLIYPHVTLYHEVSVGDRVIIHANTVIGSDGFGFAFDKSSWLKVPQLGSVHIGNDVEIGAHTTIDRGTIDDTVIEQGVKIDNQVQIAHNVVIGAYTVVAGTAAFAGSSKIGRYCLIGGGATFAGHITVCDKVQIAGMTTVTRSITKPGIYSSGTGMMPAAQWRKSVVHFRNLDEIVKRIRKLEEQGSHD